MYLGCKNNRYFTCFKVVANSVLSSRWACCIPRKLSLYIWVLSARVDKIVHSAGQLFKYLSLQLHFWLLRYVIKPSSLYKGYGWILCSFSNTRTWNHQSKQFEFAMNTHTELGDSLLSRADIFQKSLERQHEELVLNSATFSHQRPSLLRIELLPLLLWVVLCVHMGIVWRVLGAGLIDSIATQPVQDGWLGCTHGVKIQGRDFEWDLDLATNGHRVGRALK